MTTTGLEVLFPSSSSREAFLDATPNILLCGTPRAGKTSLLRVVFRKFSPHEMLFLKATTVPTIHKVAHTNLLRFCIVDIPGALLSSEPKSGNSRTEGLELDAICALLFPRITSIIYVLDVQMEPHTRELNHCKDLFQRAFQHNPQILLEVFIHKVDGEFLVLDEVRAECQRSIHEKMVTQLQEEGVSTDIIFCSTSIYDHTIYEACSHVIQRIFPEAPALQKLLDLLVASCRLDKAFLIDVYCKTFLAKDSSDFDPFNYEVCTDLMEVIIEIACIYGGGTMQPEEENEKESTGLTQALGRRTPNKRPMKSKSLVSGAGSSENDEDADSETELQDYPTTTCLVQLTSGYLLYLKEVDRYVALVCVIREENFDRQFLVDFNIKIFQEAMLRLFNLPLPEEVTSI